MQSKAIGIVAGYAALALIAGCVIDAGGGGGGGLFDRTVEYQCDDDREFRARFARDGEEVRVAAGDRDYRLELEDGGRRNRTYGDGDVQLIIDDDEARLRIKDERDYSNCESS